MVFRVESERIAIEITPTSSHSVKMLSQTLRSNRQQFIDALRGSP